MNPENNEEKVITKFSWLRIAKAVSAFVVVCAVILGAYSILVSAPFKIAWANFIHNRREHYLSCADLPFYPQVEKQFSLHQDAVRQLGNLGVISVSEEHINCKNWDGGMEFLKGDILIKYHNRSQKNAVENFLGKTFFSIPYRGEPAK